jgi:hypothetical protein
MRNVPRDRSERSTRHRSATTRGDCRRRVMRRRRWMHTHRRVLRRRHAGRSSLWTQSVCRSPHPSTHPIPLRYAPRRTACKRSCSVPGATDGMTSGAPPSKRTARGACSGECSRGPRCGGATCGGRARGRGRSWRRRQRERRAVATAAGEAAAEMAHRCRLLFGERFASDAFCAAIRSLGRLRPRGRHGHALPSRPHSGGSIA